MGDEFFSVWSGRITQIEGEAELELKKGEQVKQYISYINRRLMDDFTSILGTNIYIYIYQSGMRMRFDEPHHLTTRLRI